MKVDYQKICSDLLQVLPEKQRTILARRYGLKNNKRETLEFIGEDYGITRERVRQVESDGFLKLKPKTPKYQGVFTYFEKHLESNGGLKREDLLLEQLGGRKEKNQVYFLLNLGQKIERFGETEELYSLWAVDEKALLKAKKVINFAFDKLQKRGKPLLLKDFKYNSLGLKPLNSYLEISKKIQKNKEDFFGFKNWPEINPKGVKDKAYLIFKKAQKPLHFTKVADLLDSKSVQTVHNELIRDPRFTLVGRGIYALAEWGYMPGDVKDIIVKILEESKKPLTKEEILNEVLKQRLVKENTILLNLSNKNYFQRNSRGHYIVRET